MFQNVLSLQNIQNLYMGYTVAYENIVEVSMASSVNYSTTASPPFAYTGSVPHTGLLFLNGAQQFVDLSPLPAFTESGSATVAAWALWYSFNSWSRVLDCGNGQELQNLLLANVGISAQLAFHLYGSTLAECYSTSTSVLVTNAWLHVAGVVDMGANLMTIYLNGVSVGTLTAPVGGVPNVVRSNCYIGRSNWAGDSYFNGELDSVVLYGNAFSQSQILNLAGIIDECASNPCQSSGICVDGIDSYSCVYCNTSPCSNGGTCLSQNGEYVCQCQAGFSGSFCTLFQ